MTRIHFIHEAPTPHNNYLLDEIASEAGIELFRHYIHGPRQVPGRPWSSLSLGAIQPERIKAGYNKYFDWRLLKIALREKNCVFFVVGWESPSIVLVLLILGLRKFPLIMWDDGPTEKSLRLIKQWWRPKQLFKNILIRLINRTPGVYFHAGNIARSKIVELGISQKKLESLPFFVKRGNNDPCLREAHGCSPSTTFILAGGRLTHDKAYDVFLAALGCLKKSGITGWKAVLIGSGNEKKRLLELARSKKLIKSVDFIDWAEPELFLSYVHTCDIFVAPARFDRFPTTIISALQAGVAVVATDKVGSALEFIESRRNGIIVPAGRAEPMARALADLVADPVLRQRLAKMGKQTIEQWPVQRGVKLVLDATARAMGTCAE